MFDSVDNERTLAGRKLAQLREKPHLPGPLVELAAKVLEAQAAARREALDRTDALRLGALRPVEQVMQGAPLLDREAFAAAVEEAPAAALYKTFTGFLTDMGGPPAQAAALVREGGPEMMREAFAAHLRGDAVFFRNFAARVPNAPRSLAFLAQSGLSPQIMAIAQTAARALPAAHTWEEASCPVCAGPAYHSALVGKEGHRVNFCSFCQAAYRTIRLQCPYCRERDARKLPFFTADEEPGYRVEACLSCQGYIKTTDFRQLDRPSLACLDDLESMALDILAMKKGYARPTVSAWGF